MHGDIGWTLQTVFILMGFVDLCISQDIVVNALPSCFGSQYTGVFGEIISVNFPSPYNDDLDCLYSIKRQVAGPMSIKFIQFDLESHHDCNYDYIEIYDGSVSASNSMGRFCGDDLPSPSTLHTSDSMATIHFHTDGSIAKTGFKILYADPYTCSSARGECLPPIERCNAPHENAYCPHDYVCCLRDAVSVCGGTFTERSGVIISPGYPDEYENDMECTYIITIESGRIAVIFHDFDLEAHETCIYDYVELFDGDSTSSPLLARYCGTLAREAVSTGTSLTMHLKTDHSYTRKGFRATWGEPDCEFWGGFCSSDTCSGFSSNHTCDVGHCCIAGCDLMTEKICQDGNCISVFSECDHSAHSLPGGIICPHNGQMCADNSCISLAYQCPCLSYQVRCWDGSCASDSVLCPCLPYEEQGCENGYGCYRDEWRCDGIPQCHDHSDELGCGVNDGPYNSGGGASQSWIYIVVGMFAIIILVCVVIAAAKQNYNRQRTIRALTRRREAARQAMVTQGSVGPQGIDNPALQGPPSYGEAVMGPYLPPPAAPPNYYSLSGPQAVHYTVPREENPPAYDSVLANVNSGIMFIYDNSIQGMPKPGDPNFVKPPDYPRPPASNMAYPAPYMNNNTNNTNNPSLPAATINANIQESGVGTSDSLQHYEHLGGNRQSNSQHQYQDLASDRRPTSVVSADEDVYETIDPSTMHPTTAAHRATATQESRTDDLDVRIPPTPEAGTSRTDDLDVRIPPTPEAGTYAGTLKSRTDDLDVRIPPTPEAGTYAGTLNAAFEDDDYEETSDTRIGASNEEQFL